MICLLDCPSKPLRERGRGLLFSNSRITLKPLCAGVPSERSVRVAVIGLGNVGLPLAAAVAATGANVIGIEIDAEKVKAVNAGQSPLRGQEPGLADLVREQVSKGRLRASLDPKEASGVDAVAVCVETPIDPTTHDPSYKALKAALAGVAPLLKRGALVSIESTLAPGTMEGVVRPALERGSKRTVGRDLYLVHCPERLTTGKLLHHLTELPRVLGANDEASMRKGVAFYERFVKAEIHATDWTTAEVVKTAENAYWDVQIAFANEVALISEERGVDAFRVRDLVNTCPYRMMLSPGAGVGGHCIPKDPWLLVSPAVQSKPELIPTAREVNDFMPRRMARIVEEALAASGRKIKGARVAVLGFPYRENTRDPIWSRWASCIEGSARGSSDRDQRSWTSFPVRCESVAAMATRSVSAASSPVTSGGRLCLTASRKSPSSRRNGSSFRTWIF